MASLIASFWIRLLIIIIVTFERVELSFADTGEKWSGTTPSGLYVASDKVALLSADNFNTNVQNSSSAWLVQFYNSWCGHCIKFSPIWKKLAADIYNWRNIVKISAIDCADDQNTQHCRDYEIMGYPTIRYFGPFIKKFTIGDDFPRQKDDADYLRNEIVAQLEKTEQNADAPIPNWPRLTPYANIDDIGRQVITSNDAAGILFLILENGTSFVGRDLIMDLYGVAGLTVRRLVRAYNNTPPEIRVHSINGTPNGSSVPIASDDRRTVYYSVSEYLRRNNLLDVPDPFANRTDDGNDGGKRRTVNVKQSIKQKLLVNTVFETDLETALLYSLFHEIPLASRIEDDKMRALVAYLRVLSKYFPSDGVATRTFLSNLAEESAAYVKLTGAKFREILLKHGAEFSQKRKQWTGCKGSTGTYRGYPCGLWTMFHTLTARKYIAVEPSDNGESDAAEVLNAMTGYIRHFFGCQDCAEHFVQMSRTIADNVTNSALAVLWLWRAHNTVNRRLAGDGSEDPSYPKVQFPLFDMCPQCRYANGTAWNESNVLSYLITMYTNVHRVQNEATVYRLQSDYGGDENDQYPAAKSTQWKFGYFDLNSACLVLYVLTACMLTAFVARIFLKRNSVARGRAKYEISHKA